jgi:hypothetical protein
MGDGHDGIWNLFQAIACFSDCKLETVPNFIAYLNKHRDRLIHYQYFQLEGFTIGSGGVESGVKQIGRLDDGSKFPAHSGMQRMSLKW